MRTDSTKEPFTAAVRDWPAFRAAERSALEALVSGNPEPYQQLWAHTAEVSLLGAFGGTALGWDEVRDRLAAVAAAYDEGVYERFEPLQEHVHGDVAHTVHTEAIRCRAPGGGTELRERRVTKIYRYGEDGWRIVHMHADPLLTADFPDDAPADDAPADGDSPVRAHNIIADLTVPDLDAAREFYADYLGLSTEEFTLGWVARHTSPATGAHVQVMTRDASAPENPVISVKVDDVEAALTQAQQRGYEIVHPLTSEPWGVRRFFVRAPDGNVVNVVQRHDARRHGT